MSQRCYPTFDRWPSGRRRSVRLRGANRESTKTDTITCTHAEEHGLRRQGETGPQKDRRIPKQEHTRVHTQAQAQAQSKHKAGTTSAHRTHSTVVYTNHSLMMAA
jgi:hypothetical protein